MKLGRNYGKLMFLFPGYACQCKLMLLLLDAGQMVWSPEKMH